MVSTQKSDAARIIAVDASRRALQAQQQVSAEQTTTLQGTDQASKTRDVLAAADVDNERVRATTGAVTPATPALPPATTTGLATAEQGPFRVPGNDGVVVTPEQAAGLDNESTRFVTAMEIADPIAKREAVEQAFGTPQQFAVAQSTFAALPAAERATLLGDVAETTDLQSAVLSQKQGIARNDFVDAVRARAGIEGAALPVDEGSIAGRASEIEISLIEQSQSVRLTDEERARGVTSGLGVVRAVGGGAAMIAGGSAMLTPTGVGQVAGTAVALHGFDNFQAGVRQALSGEVVKNVTEQAIAAGVQQIPGVSPEAAETAGMVGDALLSFGGSLALSRVTAMTNKATTVADDIAQPAATTRAADDIATTTTTPTTTTKAAAAELDPSVQQQLASMEDRVADPLGLNRIEPDVREAGEIAAKEARIRTSFPDLSADEYARVRGHQAALENVDAVAAANADVLKELPESLRKAMFEGSGSVRGQLPSVDDLGGALKESRGLVIVKEATADSPARPYDHGAELAGKALAQFGTVTKGNKDPKIGKLAEAYELAATFPLTAQQQRVVGEYLEAARAAAVSGVPPGQQAVFATVRPAEIARINTERVAAGLPPLQ